MVKKFLIIWIFFILFFASGSYLILSDSDLSKDIKNQIKGYIRSQIIAWENNSNDTEVINALNNIDVDSITEAPTVGLLKWTLSQSGVPQKVWFEL